MPNTKSSHINVYGPFTEGPNTFKVVDSYWQQPATIGWINPAEGENGKWVAAFPTYLRKLGLKFERMPLFDSPEAALEFIQQEYFKTPASTSHKLHGQ